MAMALTMLDQVSSWIVGNPYLIALRQSRGDRAALAYAFVAVVLKPVGTIE